MTKYKKGDWVIFLKFNEHPVQLEEDGKIGFLDHMYCGAIFSEMTEEEGKPHGIPIQYCVKDPRTFPPGNHYGYVPENLVRFAVKSDFKSIVKSAKDQIKNGEKILKAYSDAKDNL